MLIKALYHLCHDFSIKNENFFEDEIDEIDDSLALKKKIIVLFIQVE
jgi:hypothetical protein